MWWTKGLAVAALLAGVGCASAPPPVRVSADPAAAAALAGVWEGEYWSDASGRFGSIRFALNARGDSAVGEVVMVPRETGARRPAAGNEVGPEPYQPPMPEPLRIAFVRAAGDRITGTLAPYRDPVCGCQLRTVFDGRILGDSVAGEFRSDHLESGHTTDGQWWARRVKR